MNTILAGIAALSGVIGILLTILYNRQRRRDSAQDRQLTQEQLELARDQAARLPDLSVAGVRLVEIDEVNEVRDQVREVADERAEQEAARKAREAKQKELEGMSALQRKVEMWSFDDTHRSNFHFDPFRYEGPLPDKVVLLDLTNQGRTTAFEVTGTLYFKAAYLEPLGYFSGKEGDIHLQDGVCGVEIGQARDIMLTPKSQSSLIVAVKVHKRGTTQVSYDLSSPAGSSTRGTVQLELP